MVDSVIARHRINGDRRISVVINMHVVRGGLDGFVARSIMHFDRSRDGNIMIGIFLIIIECRRIDRDVVAQLIRTSHDHVA